MRLGRRMGCAGAVLAVVLAVGAAPPQDGLLDAARAGDTDAVRALLEDGADPNLAQGDGLTALHLAAREGHLEVVAILINAGAETSATTRIGDYTPLHLAGGAGHADVVGALLGAGANPGAVTTASGVTPLHLAAEARGGEDAVRLLLEHGAPVNARERSAGQTPLMFAAAAGRAASAIELLEHGADPSIATEVGNVLRRMAISRAAQGRLLEALSEIQRATEGGTAREPTAAEVQAALAVQREFLDSEELLEQLADFHPDDLSSVVPAWDTPAGYVSENEIVQRPMYETLVGRTGGMTALLHAAREGHLEVARVLLDGGADIDQVAGDGASPLTLAALNGQFDMSMLLIERGADPDLATHTDGVSPLFAVLQTQWAFKFTDHPHPRAHDNQGTTHMDVVTALLEAGADPDAPIRTHLWYSDFLRGKLGLNLTGATPFWRAALAQDLPAMKALVAHGADPDIPTTWPAPGMREGRQNDGRLQEDSGLPMIPEGTPNMYPIHAAAGGGYMGLGAFLMNHVPNNFLNTVRYLVEELGADVNLRDSWGYTPLHYASVRGGNDLIEYLVSKGADVGAISRLGQSTADMARGGRAGYFSRPSYPGTVDLLVGLGSELRCLNTHFRGTGDFCPGAGVEAFDTQGPPGGQSRPPGGRR